MKYFAAAGAILLACAWQLIPQEPTANSDAAYRALRDGAPSETYRVENVELKRDVGKLTLRNGQVTFLPKMLDRVAIGVFTGEGRLELKPAIAVESTYLNKLTGKPEVSEEFDAALLYF